MQMAGNFVWVEGEGLGEIKGFDVFRWVDWNAALRNVMAVLICELR